MRWSALGVTLSLLIGCGDDSAPSGAESSSGSVSTAGGDPSSDDSTGLATTTTGGDPPGGPPDCGSRAYTWAALVPGPSEPGYDYALEVYARRHDRIHHAIGGAPDGMARDVTAADDPEARRAVRAFVRGDADSFDDMRDHIVAWDKATGAFGGAAVAADAYRYGTWRDQGYPCEDVDAARVQLELAIEGLHRAVLITGEPGLIARAYAHRDYPGSSEMPTTPLFDGGGDPLPEIKNNGTWRDDQSGELPDFVWEDSCSRDQLLGWVMGFGAAWEVVADDPTIDQALKDTLRADAADIARQLMTVRRSGFDLEIYDPDGRPTFHAHLHENNFEGTYSSFENGFHALLATGIVAALAYVSEDAEVEAYLYEQLLADRDLLGLAQRAWFFDLGPATNYSNYNMGFTGAWMALRYVEGDDLRESLYEAIDDLYDRPESTRPVADAAQTFFDFVYAARLGGGSATLEPVAEPDAAVVDQGIATLLGFPRPPAYNRPVTNCDDAEVAAQDCLRDDGVQVELLGTVGHNDQLVAAEPTPMAVRPRSNYYWRSNPYSVNDVGSGDRLASSSDFRVAYWIGRYSRR